MGIFDKIRGEFIDVIEWLDDSNDTMVYRFERHQNEIKNGAKLTVRETQAALLINEGEAADLYMPGYHELSTRNMPIMTTLRSWDHGFDSPFKAEVYFFNLRRFVDLKWGLKNPIMLRDREFGPVRLRAFGTYAMRIADPKLFYKEVVGTDGHFTTDEITDQLRNIIVSRFANVIGQSGIPVLDLAANYDQLGDFVKKKIGPEIGAYGIELVNFLVENISLPPNVEEALDKRTSMGMIGDMNSFMQYQAAESFDNIGQGGANPAGDAMGMGMGFAMASQMAQNMGNMGGAQQPSGGTPPPLPQEKQFHFGINGGSAGPFGGGEIRAKIQSGEITRDTLAWTEGMSGWTKAGDVEELSGYFGSMPPPLPPQ